MAVSFDLFGTLVDVDLPDEPAATVARELRERDVAVPSDFEAAYRERHVDAPEGAEVPLPAHVAAVLSTRGVEPAGNVVRRAVVAAFDPDVERRDGALAAVEAAGQHGPVGLCSNCSVPEVVPRTLLRAGLREAFDVVVTSAGCGWRKPHPGAFEALARRLGIDVDEVVHVGDDPETDGGIGALGGRFVDATAVPLAEVPARLEAVA